MIDVFGPLHHVIGFKVRDDIMQIPKHKPVRFGNVGNLLSFCLLHDCRTNKVIQMYFINRKQ